MKLLGVQTAKATGMMIEGRRVMTAIRKTATSGAVAVAPLGLVGDEQANPDVHGGLDKAIYVYAAEHYAFWETVSQQAHQPTPLSFGKMGENLTVTGIHEKTIWVGDLLNIGSVQLRVESPRNPCYKFNAVMGFKHASKMMMQSGFSGFYCSVVQPGFISAGDPITITAGERTISIDQRFAMNNRRSRQSDLF